MAITVKQLTVGYGKDYVLKNIDLLIPARRMVAIIGPNGAGKTTLLKAILGLVKPLTGQIDFFATGSIFDKNIRKKIGYVPQGGNVDWDFPISVFDTVLMGSYGQLGWIKRPKEREKRRAEEVIAQVGMTAYKNQQISRLSGGQQQRVFLARALMQDADLYLLDEPFKGVDVTTEKEIIQLLKKMKEQGKTIVMVHHDLHTVPNYFDWVVLINKLVKACGEQRATFTEQNIKATFLS